MKVIISPIYLLLILPQEYLREQPDNIKTFNIVAETTSFLNMVYSSISPASIDLVVQLFSTLNEFVSGNQANRACILNGKVVDYINFILRAGEFEQCPPEKVGLKPLLHYAFLELRWVRKRVCVGYT